LFDGAGAFAAVVVENGNQIVTMFGIFAHLLENEDKGKGRTVFLANWTCEKVNVSDLGQCPGTSHATIRQHDRSLGGGSFCRLFVEEFVGQGVGLVSHRPP
jgi:hypothetical protein